MRREGIVAVAVSRKYLHEFDDCRDSKRVNKIVSHFNTTYPTNMTMRRPYDCKYGKKKCHMCGKFERSGKYRRLQRAEQMKYEIIDDTDCDECFDEEEYFV